MDPVPTFTRGETVWLWTQQEGAASTWTLATVLSVNNHAHHESARNLSYNVVFYDKYNRKVATTVGPALIRRKSVIAHTSSTVEPIAA
ncbi:hypothetical protein BKA62DRAFT_106781 [Auriculariales sp. MPI-PUGE-AT-0066]|nr:hypothetical protein BKA62DRAFT_106781 [Auriculariales sp. MPI-PUGE-AT-0066]